MDISWSRKGPSARPWRPQGGRKARVAQALRQALGALGARRPAEAPMPWRATMGRSLSIRILPSRPGLVGRQRPAAQDRHRADAEADAHAREQRRVAPHTLDAQTDKD